MSQSQSELAAFVSRTIAEGSTRYLVLRGAKFHDMNPELVKMNGDISIPKVGVFTGALAVV
jgi:hypothetical protein